MKSAWRFIRPGGRCFALLGSKRPMYRGETVLPCPRRRLCQSGAARFLGNSKIPHLTKSPFVALMPVDARRQAHEDMRRCGNDPRYDNEADYERPNGNPE